MLRASCLMLEIKVFYVVGKVKRPAATGSQTQDTSGLSCQCSATELQQPDNHQCSTYTAQVVLNASVAHPATTQYVPSDLC